MKLTDFESAMLAGEFGEPRRQAMQQLVSVGSFFDAGDMVEVSQAHIMGDTESLGESGVRYLEALAAYPEEQRRVAVPTLTDPRGVDQAKYRGLKQRSSSAFLELRAVSALRSLGILMTDTCINYQTFQAPIPGQHVAFGDTGVVIYTNSICAARSNFEGGPAALAAALTGRTPRYGYHLDGNRRGTCLFELDFEPADFAEWGALGALIGSQAGSYWAVPVVQLKATPSSDDLKHFGAAMASYGSVALFHLPGITPEAPDVASVFDGPPPGTHLLRRDAIETYYRSFERHEDRVDVVVFAAPQLSLLEIQQLAELLEGRRVHEHTALVVATNPEVKAAADRLGITGIIEEAGGMLLSGVCFYQMYARELGQANGWVRLLTNSAKLCNIITGYGYRPAIAPMEVCVDAAIRGRM
ncbi:MAG: aconitase X catalytic domain-containing protein [Ectothiorhodospiraceae bacterium]|nr:aconitase X catalytic domain-containing protein [Ectothiorhodospiraceae bacterium]